MRKRSLQGVSDSLGARTSVLAITHKSEASGIESQRDSIHQPRVASPRATLGECRELPTTLKEGVLKLAGTPCVSWRKVQKIVRGTSRRLRAFGMGGFESSATPASIAPTWVCGFGEACHALRASEIGIRPIGQQTRVWSQLISEHPLKGLQPEREGEAATPLGLKNIFPWKPRVGARRANPGLMDAIPLGLSGNTPIKMWVMTRTEVRAPGARPVSI